MFNHIALIRWIKRIMPFGLRIFLIRLVVFFEKIVYVYLHVGYKEYTKDKKVFVLLSTDYSNLGDHAMTFAHIKFLKEKFPDHEIIEVLVGDTLKELYSIKKSIGVGDIITLKGGGNVGVEYFREELIRRFIVEYIDNLKIIMFPQTVYFPDTEFGKREFGNTVKIYNSNKNFYCFFRDRISFDKMSPYLERAFLTPDIVLSLSRLNYKKEENTHYAITCLRKDVEGIYTDEEKEIVYKVLKENYPELRCTDTIRDYKIELKDREKELISIWNEIGNAEILITDRLHGMIFAALLGTPCVVLNTYNHKLRAQYEWLKELNYIILSDLNEESIMNAVRQLKKCNVQQIAIDKYSSLFEQIYNVMV